MGPCECLLRVGESVGPVGVPSGPSSDSSGTWGLYELFTEGMALLTSRPHVAILMFICGARRKVFPTQWKDREMGSLVSV